MKLTDIGPAWGKILRGHKPLLSLEITRECPLRCPGCYAYEPGHLGPSDPLRLVDHAGSARAPIGVMKTASRQHRRPG